jgi:integrase
MGKWVGRWQGGRITKGPEGRDAFVIEKMVAGVRYAITLPVTVSSEREAEAELALFRRDPARYQADRSAEIPALTTELVARYLAWLKEKGRTEGHRGDMRTSLASWAEHIGGKDLRSLPGRSLRDLLPKLGAKQKRIAAIKGFCTFLREEELLKVSEDPSQALKVPQAKPERALTEKGYTQDFVTKTYRHTDRQDVRDVLVLQAKTGMHFSEVERVAKGKAKLRRVDDPSGIVGTLSFMHKNGSVHTISVDGQTYAAAERLVAAGEAPQNSSIRLCLGGASEATGLPLLLTGQLRHSFVDWAQTSGRKVSHAEGGLPLADVGAAIGHRSVRTTDTFYNVTKVPPMIVVPVVLQHPDDPVSIQRQRGNVAG